MSFLQPTLSAVLNSICTVFLIAGFVAIRKGNKTAHIRCMLAALLTSVLFLTNYLIHHAIHGSTSYQGVGILRKLYFTILLSHTFLAIIVVPLIGITLRWALKADFQKHKRIAPYTLAIWLYVSITGVIIYFMLYIF